MSALAVADSESRWSAGNVEILVIRLLGRQLKKEPARLRRELEQAGAHMPCDSLDLFEVLVDFRRTTGITLPKRKLKRHTMRSVRGFAEFVAKEAQP